MQLGINYTILSEEQEIDDAADWSSPHITTSLTGVTASWLRIHIKEAKGYVDDNKWLYSIWEIKVQTNSRIVQSTHGTEPLAQCHKQNAVVLYMYDASRLSPSGRRAM